MNANKLFDTIIDEARLKNDAALARAIKVAPPVISKMRHGALKVGATMILALHEIFGMPVARIRELLKEPA